MKKYKTVEDIRNWRKNLERESRLRQLAQKVSLNKEEILEFYQLLEETPEYKQSLEYQVKKLRENGRKFIEALGDFISQYEFVNKLKECKLFKED